MTSTKRGLILTAAAIVGVAVGYFGVRTFSGQSPDEIACDQLYKTAVTSADSAHIDSIYPYVYARGSARMCGGGGGRGGVTRAPK